MHRALALLVPLAVACTGGSPDGDDPCGPGASPTLALGLGETSFTPIESGADARLVRGPQGGVHLALAVDVTFLDPSEVVEAVITGTLNGAPAARSEPWVQLRCNPATSTLQGFDLRLIFDALPGDLGGQTTDVVVTLTDAGDREVSASATYMLVD